MGQWLSGSQSLFQFHQCQVQDSCQVQECDRAGNRTTRHIVALLAFFSLLSSTGFLLRAQAAVELVHEPLRNERLSDKQLNAEEPLISEPDIVRAELSDLAAFPLLLPPSRGALVDASTQPSTTSPSSPSLFWIRDQVAERTGRNQLIDQWQAYQVTEQGGLAYVDVIVNEQLWGLLNYFQRYAFVLQFGTAAKSYGYQLRVFHTGDLANRSEEQQSLSRMTRNSAARLVRLRGAHFCSFNSAQFEPGTQLLTMESAESLPCTVELIEVSGRPTQDAL